MEILEFVTELQEKYNLPEILILLAAVYFLYRKMNMVDHAVNNRPKDGPTVSQEVSEIHRKVDVTCNELKHLKHGQRELKEEIDEVKQDVKEHRSEDEKMIHSFAKDISDLRIEIQRPKPTRRKKSTSK